MVRRFLAVVAILAAVVGPDALAWGASGFSNRTLRGNYVLEAAGLVANTFGSGEITVLGLVTFNGMNGAGATITGNLTFTSSVSPTFFPTQTACEAVIKGGSTYLVEADGKATITVELSTPSTPGSLSSSGTLDFSSIIINPGVARLVLANNLAGSNNSSVSDLVICGVPVQGSTDFIRSLVLIGDVTRQQH